MKNNFRYLCIVLTSIYFSIFFTLCSKNPDDTEKIIEVENDITSNTLWTSDNTYLITKNDLQVNATLTIEAGTTIKLNYSGYVTVNNKGKIIAQGTDNNPIIFTSNKDNEKWGSITLRESDGSEFIHCHFLYGGEPYGTAPTATIDLTSSSTAKIDNCIFANNGGGTYNDNYVGVLNAQNAGTNTIITNNTFYANQLPMTINSCINIDKSNIFSKGNEKNKYNGIFVSGMNITQDTKWEEDEVAFVLTNLTTSISYNTILTLGDNVVLKFRQGKNVVLNLDSESSIKNYDGNSVFFTSYLDDTRKGDTNGDGSASSPNDSDWGGIFIEKTNAFANWSNIKYNDPSATVK